MTNPDPYQQEIAEAYRRAAHLILLRSVEVNEEGLRADLLKLSTAEDALFATQVANVLLERLHYCLELISVDARREFAFSMLHRFASTDIRDLDNLAGPS